MFVLRRSFRNARNEMLSHYSSGQKFTRRCKLLLRTLVLSFAQSFIRRRDMLNACVGIFPSTVVREHLALSPSNHCYSLRKQLDDTNILTHAKCALQLRYSGNFKLDNWQFSIDSNTFSLAALAVKRDVTSNLHIHNKIVSLRGESSIAQLLFTPDPSSMRRGGSPD